MKILVLVPQIHLLGGAERLAVEAAEELNRRPGIRADVLVMTSADWPGAKVAAERLARNGVRAVRFLGRVPQSGMRDMVRHVARLRRMLVQGSYDVIDSTLPGPTTLACWAVMGLRTGHVAGIHAIYENSIYNTFRDRVWRWSCRISQKTHFYAISKEVAHTWVTFAGVAPERVHTVSNSVNDAYFTVREDREALLRELQLEPSRPLLLFVGRLLPSKGLDTLFEATQPLLADGSASLLVAGVRNSLPEFAFGDSEDFVDRLKSRIPPEVLRTSVRWLGWREDIPRLMASADILVHPTRYEGFGLVLAEALACGLPIVSTTVGGILEVLAGTESVLVAPGDPTAVRLGIHRVLSRTRQQATRANAAGRARAEAFRSSQRVGRLLEIYSKAQASQDGVNMNGTGKT